MKITISGSIAFYEQMQQLKSQLEAKGHVVFAPVSDSSVHGKEITLDEKTQHMRNHNNEIANADCVLVYNQTKKDLPGYIGPNTLIEMGIAFFTNKKIYLMFQIPELPYKEEIEAMRPIILNNDINGLL